MFFRGVEINSIEVLNETVWSVAFPWRFNVFNMAEVLQVFRIRSANKVNE